jgi:tetratricopeptide (TPR) repeat protein
MDKIAKWKAETAGLLGLMLLATTFMGCATRSDQVAGTSSDPEGFNQQWREMIDRSEMDNAREFCEPGLENPSLEVDALICLANVEFNLGRDEYLHVDMLKMGLGPGESGARVINDVEKYLSSRVSYDPSRMDAAVAHIDRALELDASRTDVWCGKAYILQVSGRHEPLIVHLEKMAVSMPGASMNDLEGYGKNYVKDKEYLEAADVYEVIVKNWPDNFVAWCDYGAVYGMAGDFKKCRELLIEAHRHGEDDILLSNLANISIYLERFEEALPYLRRLYERNPDLTIDQLRLLLGTAVVDMDEAGKLSDKWGKTKDEPVDQLVDIIAQGLDRDAALEIAEGFFEQGDKELTLLAVELTKGLPEALYFQAGVYSRLGYYDGEIRVLETILKNPGPFDDPTVTQLEYNLGVAYFHKENFQQAEKHFKTAIDRGHENSAAHYMRGKSLFFLDQPEAARPEFERAVKLNDDPEIVGWSKQYLHWIEEIEN